MNKYEENKQKLGQLKQWIMEGRMDVALAITDVLIEENEAERPYTNGNAPPPTPVTSQRRSRPAKGSMTQVAAMVEVIRQASPQGLTAEQIAEGAIRLGASFGSGKNLRSYVTMKLSPIALQQIPKIKRVSDNPIMWAWLP